MNKTISTPLGILIIVLVAGVMGASALLFVEEIKKEDHKNNYFTSERILEGEEDGESSEEEIIEKNEFSGWEVLSHHKYSYSIKYPAEWKVSRLELVYGLTDSYVFESPSGYFLVFGAVPVESNEDVGLRTGVGGGYLKESNDAIIVSDTEVKLTKLVGHSDDKVLELMFENFEVNGYKGGGYISYNKYDENFDMINSKEIEIIKKILASIVFESLE